MKAISIPCEAHLGYDAIDPYKISWDLIRASYILTCAFPKKMSLPVTLYSSSQTRELDRIAIEDFGISGFSLMQRAGQATFDYVLKAYPLTKSFCVVCGPGNNGGDGYVIATLAKEVGFDVSLIQLGDKQAIGGDALLARQAFLKTASIESEFDEHLLSADIIIDAIFGTGLTRQVQDHWANVITSINNNRSLINNKVLAVDVPSGLNSDTGRVLGTCIKADVTMTYIGVKSGLVTAQARDYVGKLEFNDLQIPSAVYKKLSPQSNKRIISETILQDKLKPRLRCSHKGNHGHVLLIGGALGLSGAIRLAGEACLRTGAGLVSIATHPAHSDQLNLARPELMVSAVEQADALLPLIDKASVIAIGPGLGQSNWAKYLLAFVLQTDKPKVLDADALNLLAQSSPPKKIKNNNNWILTPHPAEAARLLSEETQKIEQDRYKSVNAIQEKYGGVCILKGAGSLIFNGKETAVCTAGNPGMASGGMGDLLTGIIAGLLAQGLSLSDAAVAGTYLHAKAADLAAEDGERGMLASDLFPFIRKLVNE